MSEKPNLFAIIPAKVRYDKNLRANEKLLYGELTALTNKYGYCFASNNYFAELYGVTPQAISRWINNLKKQGYITIEYTYKSGTKEIDKRLIRLVSTNGLEVSTNDSKVSTKSSGVSTNDLGGYQQKVKGNNINTNNNNTNNIYMGDNSKINSKINSKRFIKPTIDEIKEYCGQNDLRIDCERFYDYYESNDWHVGKNKMKSWKATARNWNRNNYSNNKNASNSPIYTDNNKVYDDWFNDDLSDLAQSNSNNVLDFDIESYKKMVDEL